jgi:hypothetical protein
MRRIIISVVLALVMAAMMLAVAVPALAQPPGFQVECELEGGGTLTVSNTDPRGSGFGFTNQVYPRFVDTPANDCERGPVF